MNDLNYFQACPNCGKPNHCTMEDDTKKKKPCWCENYELSEDARKELGQHYIDHGGGCICEECLKRLSETGSLHKPTKWDYFKFGVKIHPGNILYVGFSIGIVIAILQSSNLRASLLAGAIFTVLLSTLWIATSIDVGRINWKHRKEILNE